MSRVAGRVTEATATGPFLVEESPELPWGGDLALGAPGDPCWVEGLVSDVHGRPIAGARIEVWEPGGAGAPGHVRTDVAGRYGFWTTTPTAPMSPSGSDAIRGVARLPIRVTARHQRTLVTHVYVATDAPAIEAVRASLVRAFERQPRSSSTPDGRELSSGIWTRAQFDIVLAPAGIA